MLDQARYQQFTTALRGKVVDPTHPEYESARKIYNGMIDRRPRMIVRCTDVADVIAAVNYARETETLISVRGGGHNGAGLCTLDDSLCIDLSQMKHVRVDPVEKTVQVGPGCTWGDVDHATQAFGLAVPAGTVSTTGVSGLTLGGGHGYLTRKYGLTIDSLLGADVVLADGSVVRADVRHNPDLFWAIRGGGGNFGVVTSFLFRAYPVSQIYSGITLWNIDQAAERLRWYADFIGNQPDDLFGFFAFLNVPPGPPFPEQLHGKTMCGVVWAYLGSPDKVDQTFQPILQSPPAFQMLGPMPYIALQTLFDPLLPSGLQWYWKGDFFNEISDEAIKRYVEFGSRLPSALSTVHLYPIDGAVHRIAADGTAWAYRDAKWSVVIAGIDPDPASAPRLKEWATRFWEAVHPHSAGGAYINFMMEEGDERVRATYGGNYDRLVEIKNKYDPDNLFRRNQNIKPTVARELAHRD
jgi:FAD/FMN-containing dehydrogenase